MTMNEEKYLIILLLIVITILALSLISVFVLILRQKLNKDQCWAKKYSGLTLVKEPVFKLKCYYCGREEYVTKKAFESKLLYFKLRLDEKQKSDLGIPDPDHICFTCARKIIDFNFFFIKDKSAKQEEKGD